jgi:hypothetical protein
MTNFQQTISPLPAAMTVALTIERCHRTIERFCTNMGTGNRRRATMGIGCTRLDAEAAADATSFAGWHLCRGPSYRRSEQRSRSRLFACNQPLDGTRHCRASCCLHSSWVTSPCSFLAEYLPHAGGLHVCLLVPP